MRIILLALALLLAGCASGPESIPTDSMEDADGDGFLDAIEIKYGSDPENATSVPDVMVHVDASLTDTVQTVGTGVPSVQCPADQVNSQMLTWTLTIPEGARNGHVANLEISISGAMTVNDADLFVYSPSGELLGSATGSTASETVTVGKHAEVGDYEIEVRGCSGTGDVSVDATGIVGWIPSDEELLSDDHADDGHTH